MCKQSGFCFVPPDRFALRLGLSQAESSVELVLKPEKRVGGGDRGGCREGCVSGSTHSWSCALKSVNMDPNEVDQTVGARFYFSRL